MGSNIYVSYSFKCLFLIAAAIWPLWPVCNNYQTVCEQAQNNEIFHRGIDDDRKSLEKKEIILKERKNCKRCASEINCIWQFIRWMFGCFFARRLKASKSAWDRNFRNGVASKNRIYELPFWWVFFPANNIRCV